MRGIGSFLRAATSEFITELGAEVKDYRSEPGASSPEGADKDQTRRPQQQPTGSAAGSSGPSLPGGGPGAGGLREHLAATTAVDDDDGVGWDDEDWGGQLPTSGQEPAGDGPSSNATAEPSPAASAGVSAPAAATALAANSASGAGTEFHPMPRPATVSPAVADAVAEADVEGRRPSVSGSGPQRQEIKAPPEPVGGEDDWGDDTWGGGLDSERARSTGSLGSPGGTAVAAPPPQPPAEEEAQSRSAFPTHGASHVDLANRVQGGSGSDDVWGHGDDDAWDDFIDGSTANPPSPPGPVGGAAAEEAAAPSLVASAGVAASPATSSASPAAMTAPAALAAPVAPRGESIAEGPQEVSTNPMAATAETTASLQRRVHDLEDRLREATAAADSQRETGRAQLQAVAEKHRTLESRYAELQAESQRVKDDLAKTQKSVEECTAENERLKEELARRDDEHKALRLKLEAAEAAGSSQEAQNQEHAALLARLCGPLAAAVRQAVKEEAQDTRQSTASQLEGLRSGLLEDVRTLLQDSVRQPTPAGALGRREQEEL